jgi:hypothetical protein
MEWLFQILAMVGCCAGVYAGIRSDLVRAICKAEAAEAAAIRAHSRIDDLIIQGKL